nr:P1 protein [Watermelon mosaic virus]
MATIMFGDFTVQLKHSIVTEKRKRVIETTKLEQEVRMETVCETVMESITVGCTTRCAGLSAYTKSSLRRAIKEGDLSASGGCNYCGLRALVGEGRERVISVPRVVTQQKEIIVTKEVPHIYEEEYEVEVPYLVTEPLLPMVGTFPGSDVYKTTVQEKALNNIVTKDMMAKSEPSMKQVSRSLVLAGRKEVCSYDLAIKRMDEAIQRDSALQRRLLIQQYSTIRQLPKGAVQLGLCSYEQAKQRAELACKRKQEEDFLSGKYEQQAYIGTAAINTAKPTGRSVGFRTIHWKPTPKQNKIKRAKKQCDKPTYVLKEILSLAARTGKPVEFITRRTRKNFKVNYVRKYGAVIPKFTLPHEEGKYVHQELQYANICEFLPYICMFARYKTVCAENLTHGDSGLLFDERSLITTEHTTLPYFVVRGRENGKLVSAFEEFREIGDIQHY